MLFFFFYNLLFPFVFLFFIPGLLIKLIQRTGIKHSFPERFAIFSKEKAEQLKALKGCIWLHAVSVGETNLALTFLQAFLKKHPGQKFVISTTTTTAQEIAAKRVPEGVGVIFCPIDFLPIVKKTYRLLEPSALVIFETELWPNLINQAKKRVIPVALLNARMSDHSAKGYCRFRFIFHSILEKLDIICVQTLLDQERFLSVAPDMKDRIFVCGNIKFDQRVPEHLKKPDLSAFFGMEPSPVILGASTHNGEESFIARAFLRVREKFPKARLVIVPRHAERGAALMEELKPVIPEIYRKSTGGAVPENIQCLLADTTGELMGFIASADLVIMGKTLAGNHEGQNIIEPAILGKAIICGSELSNFREALSILEKAGAVIKVNTVDELGETLLELAGKPEKCAEIGSRAENAMSAHRGAAAKNLEKLESLL